MNIAMLTSETVPFSKSGGLADVVGSLSPALAKDGHDVKVFMPLYGFLDINECKKDKTFTISTLNGEEVVEIYKKRVNKVDYLAIAHPVFTSRTGIYGQTSFKPYSDNAYRYLLMCKACVEYLKRFNFKADILHAHDWTAGVALYLAKVEKLKLKTVFTIHNLAYQGVFSRFDLLRAKIVPSERLFSLNSLERQLNMLKTGLEYADWITTVSPTYSQEIQTPAYGCGLDKLLKSKANILSGILNGIDKKEWNPARDEYFKEHFSSKNPKNKALLKAYCQKLFSLEVNPDIPLIGMISRLAEQKGFSELLNGDLSALERLAKDRKCQFIIIGTGSEHYENKLRDIGARYNNVSVNIVFSAKLSHIVEGASDFFLMPSRYEPCGLNQMYSLVYGTLPIAHKIGGLADSIIDIREDIIHGDGFLFDDLSSDGIYNIVNTAIEFYHDKEHFNDARLNALNCNFSWDESAKEYVKIYSQLIGGIR